tara:strand:- start:587 stop:1354 length:768 start_codon:yes stop_codon:yes gene_type:complete
MKVVILAGGLGTRISEQTYNKPKPMIEIGTKPILWHIMKIYSNFGYNDFIICGGYKIEVIKKFFLQMKSKINFSYNNYNYLKKSKKNSKKWKVHLVDTGINSNTGGRLKRLEKILSNEENFFFTYGDGLSNININKLLKFHIKNKKIATLTAITPPSRFGILKFNGNKIKSFFEKRDFEKDYLVNGGFFVFTNKIFKYIKNDKSILEQTPIISLTKKGQIVGYKHKGFWFSMDTQRDHIYLNKLWKKKKAPWKSW